MKITILLTALLFSCAALAQMHVWNGLLEKYSISKEEQSFCFNTDLDQRNYIFKSRPASVTKLFTTLISFKKLGLNYQHKTVLRYNSSDNHLHFKGGRDPFFVFENLVAIISEINKRNLRVDTISFDLNFFFNWSNDQGEIKESLQRLFLMENWTEQEKKTYLSLAHNPETMELVKNFNLNKFDPKFEGYRGRGFDLEIEYYSAPLLDQFKQVNIYSNNFYTDTIFETLGGTLAFNQYFKDLLQLNDDEVYFYTGSGLGENYVSCRATIRLLKAIKSFANKKDISVTSFISVPSVDNGTLRARFGKPQHLGHLVAKTGTLRHTSALAGFINSTDGLKEFVVFNHTWKTGEARKFQNEFIETIMDQYISSTSFDYQKVKFTPLVKNYFRE